MSEFLNALTNPDVSFLRNALIVGILASVTFGIIGTYVVVRRISYLSGAISHSILGGIGASLFLQKTAGWEWFHPMLGAILSAVLAALVIGWVSLRAHEREDTIIGALWAVGMAIGLLFISKTPGYVDAMSYLFGNILMSSHSDIVTIAILDGVVLLSVGLFYNVLLAMSFDEEFARLRGVRTNIFFLFLLCLIAVTVVLFVRMIGIILVIALLTIPPAIAGFFSKKLWQMMLFSVIVTMILIVMGLGISYPTDLPTGPVIIVLAGGVYLFLVIVQSLYFGWMKK